MQLQGRPANRCMKSDRSTTSQIRTRRPMLGCSSAVRLERRVEWRIIGRFRPCRGRPTTSSSGRFARGGGLRVDNMLMHAVKKNFQTFEEHMLADQPITLSYTYRPRCWLAGGLRDDTERGRSSSTKDLSLTGRTKIFRSANTLRKSFQGKYLDWMELHELFSFQACCFLACEDRRSTFSSLD
jgi:hypothetical protein